MNNKDNNKDLNPFEKQMEEIQEMQKNINNPGYFIGSGKVPLFYKNLHKSPLIMLIVGIILSLPTIYNLINNFSIETIISNIIIIIISGALIIGGTIRLLKTTS